MACSECKKKSELKSEYMKSTEFVGKGAVWLFIIWLLFGLYGLYNIIRLFV